MDAAAAAPRAPDGAAGGGEDPLPAVSVRGLVLRYDSPSGESFEARLDTLDLAPGQRAALAGPSGCGKSTVLDALGLIRAPAALELFALADGAGGRADLTAPMRAGDIDALAPARADRLGYVLQQGGLLPFLTVAENIAMGGPPGAETAARTAELAAHLGLGGLEDRLPAALSIGQRQRVCVARALVGRPALILADEPTSSLDPPRAREVMELIIAEAEARGAAVLLASHDWDLLDAFGFARIMPEITREGPATIARFSLREAPGAEGAEAPAETAPHAQTAEGAP